MLLAQSVARTRMCIGCIEEKMETNAWLSSCPFL